MTGKQNNLCRIVTLSILGTVTGLLLIGSLIVDYQKILALEHIRFRSGFPSQANWIPSPIGTLKSYLFNVTNSEAFLNGTDPILKLQEVGPIVYRIRGINDILNQTDSTLIYKKSRYNEIIFDPEASCAPDILNQTVILPNFVLLGAAAKLHNLGFILKQAFNVITASEPPFLKKPVNYFLWNFTRPSLDLLSNYIPNIVPNVGILHNALKNKRQVFNIKIGTENGYQNFFRLNHLNEKTYFPEHAAKLGATKSDNPQEYCPIYLDGAFDNSLFTPFLDPQSEIRIVADESCRTISLKYKDTVEHLGFTGYRFLLGDIYETPKCLQSAMGIELPNGMFDVSRCLLNDVPASFSFPHFYASAYNWSAHLEGISPNQEIHEPYIIIEPTTGIPVEVKYKFQSNMPMPDMSNFNRVLRPFSNLVVPTFWYEYDLDDLPPMVLFLMRLNVYGTPVVQPVFIVAFFILTIYCFFNIYLLLKGLKVNEFIKSLKK